MPEREVMPKQPPEKRVKNFNEVALGYTEEQALKEACRCLECKKPKCVEGCPVDIDIPNFIKRLKEKDPDGAIRIIKDKNSLPAICGRVCPQENQCEKTCILSKKGNPIAIGRLERFAADWEIENNKNSEPRAKGLGFNIEKAASCSAEEQFRLGTRDSQAGNPSLHSGLPEACPEHSELVAVIGSGPAGLTCAGDLAKRGYRVTIFESLHASGGVLRYGIPEFRMPKHIVNIETAYVKNLGVDIYVDVLVGKTVSLDDLREQGFKAFFIGTGAGLPYFMEIEGEDLNGVYSANEFLTRINLMKAYKFPEYDTPVEVGRRVAVIGGGNVAMDSARCAVRLGADECYIVYRRSEKEMPARIEEIENAKEEGVQFELLTNPIKILGNEDGCVKAMRCIRNRLGEPDESGRQRPVPIEGSEFTIEVDTIVCAIGQGPNPLLLSNIPDLKLTKKGNIVADTDGSTSIPGVFAGGDIVTGAATVIGAMGAGKSAAETIERYLKK